MQKKKEREGGGGAGGGGQQRERETESRKGRGEKTSVPGRAWWLERRSLTRAKHIVPRADTLCLPHAVL